MLQFIQVRDIVELNEKRVDLSDNYLPKLQHGDAVVIKYLRRGAESFTFLKGVVNLQLKHQKYKQ